MRIKKKHNHFRNPVTDNRYFALKKELDILGWFDLTFNERLETWKFVKSLIKNREK
jgi:hypothetical protein